MTFGNLRVTLGKLRKTSELFGSFRPTFGSLLMILDYLRKNFFKGIINCKQILNSRCFGYIRNLLRGYKTQLKASVLLTSTLQIAWNINLRLPPPPPPALKKKNMGCGKDTQFAGLYGFVNHYIFMFTNGLDYTGMSFIKGH